MIGKTSTTSVMEINMRDGVIALQQTAWPPETMTILSRQSWPILGKMLVLQICLQPKGLFPDKGFHYKKGTKQSNKTSLSPFLPSSLPSFRSIIAAASLTHPQQTKLSPNFKKIVLLGISNFKQLKAKQNSPIQKKFKNRKTPQVRTLALLVSLHYKKWENKNTGLCSPIEASLLQIVVFLLDLRSTKYNWPCTRTMTSTLICVQMGFSFQLIN